MKICVIGYSGAGKSTLADILGKKFSLPVLHLDATFWYGDWQSRSREEQSELVKKFLNDNPDGWVIDGNYFKICLERFAQCDKVYYLNYNRFFCLGQAIRRFRKYRGTVRDDCPCIEKIDLGFIWWILHKGRTLKKRKRYRQILNLATGEKFIFKNRRQLERHLRSL